MKAARNAREAVLGPLQRKTFGAALVQTLREHVPPLGALTAQALADHIQKLIDQYFPPAERLRMGQVLWPAIDERESAGWGKKIEDCKLKPVMIQAIGEEDIQALLDGVKRREVRKGAAVRMFEQAHEQGGVLTHADVGAILHLSAPTVGRYVKEWEEAHKGQLVPRRATIHDMGPTLTHKAVICRRVILEGQSVEQAARATRHSPAAVTRYVVDYRRVQACLRQGLSPAQTAYATGMSPRLVEQYEALIDQERSKQSCKKEAR